MDKSTYRTALRRYDEALKANDSEAAEKAYLEAVKTIDQTASKGVIHKNAADRKKAQLAKKRTAATN